MTEVQTCPRRMYEFGPWAHAGGLDRWERNRWRPGPRRMFLRLWLKSRPRWERWPKGFPQPRSCSFCGGVHPDDAVVLVRAGWEVEPATGKSYKRYLHPPGTGAAIERLIQQVRDHQPFEGDGPVEPVPPVKLYTMHFSPAQIAAFNDALAAQSQAEGK